MIKKIISIKLRYDKYREKGKRENKMNYEKLLEPIKVGNHIWRNRIVMPACETRLSNPDGSSSREMADYYGERAKGGAAAIIVENTFVDNKESRSSLVSSGMYNDHMIASHYYVSQAIKEGGADAILQISHGGRQANAGATGLQCVGPSAIPCKFVQRQPRALSKEEIIEIEDCFAAAAVRAKMAGFDGVEIHGAHGYLICSFLSPYTNHRTDEYGGSFENRIKYPMDVLKTVIDEVNGEVPVQIRVSVDEYVDDGMKFEEVKTVCHVAKEMGVASISLSAGCYDAVEYAIQPMFIPQGFIIPFAKELKAEIDIPVIVAARLNDAHLIENVVENDEADIVAIGRGLIADPLLVDKIKAHDYDNIRYCIACNQGCIDRVLGGMPAHCMVNPVAGEELTCKLKGKSDKKVVIIGAGPAGMEAAITAAQRGMKVTVYEKGELGGKFKALSTPPEKDTFMMFDRYLVSQMKKYNIEVINKEVKADDEFDADTIILATGSKQIVPPIQGINQEFVLQAEDVLENQKELKGNVVVIGGGLVGTETCKYLGNQGAHVTLVEMKDNIADGIGATFIGHMFAKLAEYQVDVKTSETVKEIKNHEVVLSNTTVPCDYVVIAAGYKARNELAEELSKKYDVKVVGDASSPRRILDATAEAYRVINEL